MFEGQLGNKHCHLHLQFGGEKGSPPNSVGYKNKAFTSESFRRPFLGLTFIPVAPNQPSWVSARPEGPLPRPCPLVLWGAGQVFPDPSQMQMLARISCSTLNFHSSSPFRLFVACD